MQILFGGTFDPIHIGHINLGLYISKLFNQQVSLLPISGIPNYKSKPIASINNRICMLEIIQNKYPNNFTINYSEANLTEYSPTIITLKRLAKESGQIQPTGFIIGGDSLLTLDSCWDNWQELFEYTNFIVAMRPNYDLSKISMQLTQFIQHRLITDITKFDKNTNGQILITEFTPADISSTHIRQSLKNNQNIQEYLESDIYSYIIQNKLYN